MAATKMLWQSTVVRCLKWTVHLACCKFDAQKAVLYLAQLNKIPACFILVSNDGFLESQRPVNHKSRPYFLVRNSLSVFPDFFHITIHPEPGNLMVVI